MVCSMTKFLRLLLEYRRNLLSPEKLIAQAICDPHCEFVVSLVVN